MTVLRVSRYFTLLFLFFFLINFSDSTPHNIVTVFPNNVRSERDLPVCPTPGSVCSLIQKQYWLPTVMYRYCRCAEGADCPADWAGTDSDIQRPVNTTGLVRVKLGPAYSLTLNNRAQMKFCTPVREMERCLQDIAGMVQLTISTANGTSYNQTSANCFCPINHAWQRSIVTTGNSQGSSYYTCQALRRCRPRSSCGVVTLDTFSVYPKCLCRRGSVCTVEDHLRTGGANLTLADELFYSGPAHSGFCKP